MTKYEKLIVKAERDGIKIIEIDFGTCKKCGKCVDNLIFINSALSETEKYEILLEELGHYKTTYGDISDQNIIENRKKELVARRWGFQRGVSLVGIIQAFEHGALTAYDMAQFLGVTEKYLTECIEDYQRKYGIGYKLEQYYIRFTPRLGVYKTFNPVK